ncbi:hypothetical protein X740_05375 [Mesorhizobium sp. LNHC221B00]|uniref:hypothetical protein n=1 Tax=Mesorhizobium sp. LNHC221B00 TaxID=1287233 RepID=UPI0003CE505A|nr:hypothetical protein [Mesorhizobium sp. LNHC221B00]ESY82201.1 hypothetical protein X740_05375 [Mesorhizobium sp. LNHC221B00]
MNDKTNQAKKGGTDRKDRLAEQLRANLQKRKAQSRSRLTGDADKRRAGEADQRPEGLGGAKEIQKD